MIVEVDIDEEGDDLNDVLDEVARQVREEIGASVVAIETGEPGHGNWGDSKDEYVTFRELIGTIEYGEHRRIQTH